MSDLAIPDQGEYQQNREKSAGRCPEGLQLKSCCKIRCSHQPVVAESCVSHPLAEGGPLHLGVRVGSDHRRHRLLPQIPQPHAPILSRRHQLVITAITTFDLRVSHTFRIPFFKVAWLFYSLSPWAIDRTTDQTYVRWRGVSTIKNNLQKQGFTFRCYSWLQITYLSSLYFLKSLV